MPTGLRKRLAVAFCLMSVFPLLVLGYVVTNHIFFPQFRLESDLTWVLGITIFVSVLGFLVVRSLVLPIVQLASGARAVAAGELEWQADVDAPGEVGALGMALNQITQRIRENMEQLREYGEQTRSLNLEINQRILAFSHLLQVSTMITQQADVEEVVAFALGKISQMEGLELSCLLTDEEGENSKGQTFLVKAAMARNPNLAQLLLKTKVAIPWAPRIAQERRTWVIDGNSPSHEREILESVFGMANAVCQPIIALSQGTTLLFSANREEGFTFTRDCLEILGVFAEQIAIALENDFLSRRAKELETIDTLTGLFNASYMKSRLQEEIQRAIRYHRPCSLVLFNLDSFQRVQDLYGALTGEALLRQFAEVLKKDLTEADRAGRVGVDDFALILPERNKREALELAEEIRRKIEESTFTKGLQRLTRVVTVSGGVSENPLDGVSSEALFGKAQESLRLAKMQGKNRIVTT